MPDWLFRPVTIAAPQCGKRACCFLHRRAASPARYGHAAGFQLRAGTTIEPCSVGETCAKGELPGTKLRVLYQCKTGCDLVDLAVALKQNDGEPDRIIQIFSSVSRTLLEQGVHQKRCDPQLASDLVSLTNSYARDFEGRR